MISLSQGVRVDSNDLGGHYHRKLTSLKIPKVFVKVLLSTSGASNHWLEAAEIITDAYLDIYASPRGHRKMTATQIAYVEEQDILTNRARQMLVSLRSQGVKTSSSRAVRVMTFISGAKHRNGLYLPQPLLPKLPEPDETRPLQQDEDTDEQPSTSWPMPGQLSESDTEEGISEADRDARLA
jgi:hypothetical protein